MDVINNDSLKEVFGFIPENQLLQLKSVCRRWNELIDGIFEGKAKLNLNMSIYKQDFYNMTKYIKKGFKLSAFRKALIMYVGNPIFLKHFGLGSKMHEKDYMRLLNQLCNDDDIEIVKNVYRTIKKKKLAIDFNPEHMKVAVKYGQYTVMKYFIKKCVLLEEDINSFIGYIIRDFENKLFRKCVRYNENPDGKSVELWLSYSCKYDNREVIDYLMKKFGYLTKEYVIECCIYVHNNDLANELMTEFEIAFSSQLLNACFIYNNQKLLMQHLHKIVSDDIGKNYYKHAISKKFYDFIYDMTGRLKESLDYSLCLKHAGDSGSMLLVQYYVGLGADYRKIECNYIVQFNLEIIKYLVNTSDVQYLIRIMKCAILQKRCAVLKHFIQKTDLSSGNLNELLALSIDQHYSQAVDVIEEKIFGVQTSNKQFMQVFFESDYKNSVLLLERYGQDCRKYNTLYDDKCEVCWIRRASKSYSKTELMYHFENQNKTHYKYGFGGSDKLKAR